ncbi:MAG: TraR/DksA family transcriptional regulator [Mycobacteriales bacterium]
MSEKGSATHGGTTAARRSAASSRAEARATPATGPEDEPWTADEMAGVRRELEEQAQGLRGEIEAAEASWTALQRDGAGEGTGDDQADTGSKTFEREHELSLANNSRDLLAQVQRALGRLADATYGGCESCRRPIGKARLQAFPRATLCVSCKQREERR